jgi:hypothetical protein
MTEEEKNKLNEVYEFVQRKKRQQLDFPLDVFSTDIIRDRALMFIDKNTSTVTADQSIGVNVNGVRYAINVKKTS